MSRTYNLKGSILEILEEAELSKRDLYEEIRERSGRSMSAKSLNESLMSLLKEGKIYISDYDFDVYRGIKRIQSIKPDGIIFGLIRNDLVEIDGLLKQLEGDDLEEVKKASFKLKKIFTRKMEEAKGHKISSKAELNRTNELFNQTIYHFNSQTPEQRLILKNKLTWSLSDEEGSVKLFNDIINYVQYQKI